MRKSGKSRAKFGQLSWEVRKSCPKTVEVQTAFIGSEEKLSEVTSSSDSFNRKRGKAVRSDLKFRQLS
ncbi:hypothetical protein J7E32_07620 [Bacillus sp. ISL-55]|nr:hypothetical protein [Bacillus sp. ISL-55]